jgi:hypothetical protein
MTSSVNYIMVDGDKDVPVGVAAALVDAETTAGGVSGVLPDV